MKSLVVYYSQTGNTKKVARAIHRGLSSEVERCDLKTVKEADPREVDQYDLIGLGSPVWCGAETPNIRRFVENIPRQPGRHIFSFNTHGLMPEQYFPTVVRRLKGRGFTVIGLRDWFGDARFQMAPSPYFTHGHPDAVDLREAEEFGREMAQVSRRIAAGETGLIPPVPEQVLTPQLLALTEFYRSGHNPHGYMTYDEKKCLYPKCRLCIDHCLMEYIDLSAQPRSYGSKGNGCDMWLGCTFCEMICPTGAISCDWEQFHKDFGEKIGVILDGNPLARAAEDCISSGRLRLLVPREEVRWDRPYLKVHPKRPRFKIPRDED
jgi:flavodoxin/NAD-dependent dihydropyrimidine dehydrogenase PreA subunit